METGRRLPLGKRTEGGGVGNSGYLHTQTDLTLTRDSEVAHGNFRGRRLPELYKA